MVSALGLKEGEDLDFLKYGDQTFLVAKKNDIVKLLSKSAGDAPKIEDKRAYSGSMDKIQLSRAEIDVLKKLDTLKYNDRVTSKVNALLDSGEKEILQTLMKKKIALPFKKPGEKESHYSIQKNIYDRFLYRKNRLEGASDAEVQQAKPKPQSAKVMPQRIGKAWEQNLGGSNAYVDVLESKGFVVLNNEADAAMVSEALETSIRQGLVLGTRAFNKKFYIGLRGFINRHASRILKAIDQKSLNVEDIAKELDLDEDGVRTILYVLSESGDVTEVRKDIFRSA